jgi:putative membrane protein
MSSKRNLINKISKQLIISGIWSVIVLLFHYKVRPIAVPPTIHNLIGLALGLLLVFRTNSSYDRFWEARKMIGTVIGQTKSLLRALEVFFHQSPGIRYEVAVRLLVFNFAVMKFMRNEPKALNQWKNLLGESELQEVINSKTPPLTLLLQISRILQKEKEEKRTTEIVQMKFERHIQTLAENFGGCERILFTPLPKVYVTHLHLALLVYCYSLPFVLIDSFHWAGMTVLGTVFLAFVLLGIEEIGVEMENPFGKDADDLPLDELYASIEGAISEQIGLKIPQREYVLEHNALQ